MPNIYTYRKYLKSSVANLLNYFGISYLRRTDSCRILTLAALILFPVLASGQIEFDTDTERFSYWADCQPMQAQVTVTPNDDPDLTSTTADMVESMLEARLRSAKLYSEDAVRGLLLVQLLVLEDESITVHVEYMKPLVDPFSSAVGLASTFSHAFPVPGGSLNILRATLEFALDKFIANYLRVNEDSCK